MISSKSLATNFSIQTFGKILALLVGLISIAIMTRALGTEGFGEFTTAITYLQFFGVMVDFGLTLTLIVMISEKGADEKNIVGNFFGLRLVSGFILFGLSPILVLAFPWSLAIKQAVLVGSFAYFLMGGATMLVGIFQKHETMWRPALAELINRIALVILVAFFAYSQMGVVAMVFAILIANLVWIISMIYFAKPYVKVRPLFEFNIWKKIISRSWPIAISTIFNLLYLKGDILILSYFKDQTEVGLYGLAYKLIDILTILPMMFMGLLLPSMSKAWTEGKKDLFKKRVAKSFDVFMIVIIPIIFGTQVLGVELIGFVAGNEYLAAGHILKILVLALVGVFLGGLFGHLVVAINKQKQMILGYAAVALITLPGYFYFIPLYGMWGAAWMTILSETLIALFTFIMVYKHSRALPNLSVFLKSILSSGIMLIALIYLPKIHVLISILVGIIIYVGAMLMVKGINRNEILNLVSKKTV
jgi:O-antigen/teichoic acid export membrane protein